MKRREFCAGALAGAALGWRARTAFAAPAEGIAAVGRTGRELVLSGGDVADLRAALRGPLILAGEAGYDQARRLWNGSFDRRPALIARCAGAGDVVSAVEFARSHDLLVAVRGGGHSLSGQSGCDGGLVIDLSAMRGIRVDPATRTAGVQGGALLGDLDRESQAFGLATPAGRISHTGAAGLTLGGGFGRLTRRFGLACDNLRAADVVLANGRLVRAAPTEDADLLWGLQGGGGNFGVVTHFEYRLHPVEPRMYGGILAFPMSRARQVLLAHAELLATAPDELFVDAALGGLPTGEGVALVVCWSGPPARGESVMAPFRKLGAPMMDTLGPATYVQLQSAQDASSAHGAGNYERSGFLATVTPALINAALAAMEAPHPPGARILITGECGGEFNRVAPAATAFFNRDAVSTLIVQARWPDPRDERATEVHLQWARATFTRLEPHTKGFYVNTLASDDPAQRIRATYGTNYDRLLTLKRRVDPTNLFRRNANIAPEA